VHPVLAALAAATALFAVFSFLRHLRRDRLVADTAPARIRSAAQGYVKLCGRAVPARFEPTLAPLSRRPCVWWSYEIARDDSDRERRDITEWRTVESAACVELFMLVDEDDARCLVGPVSAEITPTTSSVWYGEEPRPALPPPLTPPPVRYGGWRYTERLIDVDARLSVLGELRSHSQVGDVNLATQEKLRAWKQDQAGLLARFDANHDGRIDAAEWEAARTAAARESQAQVLSTQVQRISVISQPLNGEPFLIAPLDSRQLVQREKVFAGLYFALGIVSCVLCAWALRP